MTMQDVCVEFKADAARCDSLGREISDSEDERRGLIDTIHEFEEKDRELRNEIVRLNDRLATITAAEGAASAAASRAGLGPVSEAVMRLVFEKEKVETARDRARDELANLKRPLEQSKRRRRDVERILDRLHGEFNQLGCSMAFVVR